MPGDDGGDDPILQVVQHPAVLGSLLPREGRAVVVDVDGSQVPAQPLGQGLGIGTLSVDAQGSAVVPAYPAVDPGMPGPALGGG